MLGAAWSSCNPFTQISLWKHGRSLVWLVRWSVLV